MPEQTEAFPLTDAEKRLQQMTKIQVKLTEDVDKAEKAIDNAVEKHRIAQNLLQDCEALIAYLQTQLGVDGNGELS